MKAAVKESFMAKELRQLDDLISVGPAMVRDFQVLGIRSVSQLARQNPDQMYERLCRTTGKQQDICCLDVFRAAVAQARNPRLPTEKCQWWYWSRKRIAEDSEREPTTQRRRER
jgi:nucleotidyltransferase/DNA polymerase involved in DNA repair